MGRERDTVGSEVRALLFLLFSLNLCNHGQWEPSSRQVHKAGITDIKQCGCRLGPFEVLIQPRFKSVSSLILCVYVSSRTDRKINTMSSQRQPLSLSLAQITSRLVCADPLRSEPTEDANWHSANEGDRAPRARCRGQVFCRAASLLTCKT